VRYLISPPPISSPFRVGKWNPVSTSDLGSPWGGSGIWVRGQGTAIAKAIWFHRHFDRPDVEVSWSGMTDLEKEELTAWLKDRAERLKQQHNIELNEYEARKALHGDNDAKVGMRNHYKSRLACRADCGKQDVGFACSKCKVARYCNAVCQAEDWKVSLAFLLCLFLLTELTSVVPQNLLWNGNPHTERVFVNRLSRSFTFFFL
jgi:hypothetical protein